MKITRLKAYIVGDVVSEVSCNEPYVLRRQWTKSRLLMDFGARITCPIFKPARMQVTVYPAPYFRRRYHKSRSDGIMLSNVVPETPRPAYLLFRKSEIIQFRTFQYLLFVWGISDGSCEWRKDIQIKVWSSGRKPSGQGSEQQQSVYLRPRIMDMR